MRFRRSAGACIVCDAPNCSCPGSEPDSLQVQRLMANRRIRTSVPINHVGLPMSKKTPPAPSSIHLEPGESNKRAVRNTETPPPPATTQETVPADAGAPAEDVPAEEEAPTAAPRPRARKAATKTPARSAAKKSRR